MKSLRQTAACAYGSRPAPGRRRSVTGYRWLTLRRNPLRQLPPRLQRPIPRRGTGRRRQHKNLRPALIARLPPQQYPARRPAIKQARRLLARERNRPRPILSDLGPEPRHVDRLTRDLVIHPGARLGEISEADPELDQACELAWLIPSRRDAGLMNRAPEAVAGMGVIVPDGGRARAGGGADEDEAEIRTELVGEAVANSFGQSAGPRMVRRYPNGDRWSCESQAIGYAAPTPSDLAAMAAHAGQF